LNLYTKVSIRILCVCAGVLAPSISLACSVVGEYVRPTNFELVQLADAIVVAGAVGQSGSRTDSSVRFRVSKVFKGGPVRDLNIRRTSLGAPPPSDPNDLTEPNPEAFQGPCIRRTFAKNNSYVLFLARDDRGGYSLMDYPFTRVDEDYFGPDSLWARTITSYLDIQTRFSGMTQLAELERLMQVKQALASEGSQKQAADILDHLKSWSPYKPTDYLLSLYETLERGELPPYSLRSPEEDEEKSEAQELTRALFGIAPARSPGRREQMRFLLTSLVNGEHPEAMPLFDRLIGALSITPATLGLSLRFLAKNGEFERAFDLMQTRAFASLPLLSASDAAGLIQDIAKMMRGQPRHEGDERWRASSRAKTTWPELALRLYWYQYTSFGGEPAVRFSEEISSLPLADYRARAELTLARAGDFDKGAESWAIAELLNEPQRQAHEAQVEAADDDVDNLQDPALLPMQALVRAYGEKRDAVLLKVFCQSAARREILIQSFGKWGDDLDDKLLARMAATPQLTEEERDMLGMAVAELYARRRIAAARFGTAGGLLHSSVRWYELLSQIAGGKKVDAEPIRCER
jgi:hypothetical protein